MERPSRLAKGASTNSGLMGSTTPAAHDRREASSVPLNGGGSTVEHSTLTTATTSAVPDGTTQSRVTVPPALTTPPKNHTCPCCPVAQVAPEVGFSGCVLAGKE